MEESILLSIKTMLGSLGDSTEYESDIIFHINSAFGKLRQLGVGPKNGFRIEDEDAVWTDFTGDVITFDMAKSYVYIETKLIFDPPPSSVTVQLMKEQAKEYEWRLAEAAEFEIQNGGE